MTKEYIGEFYYTELSKVPKRILVKQEKRTRDHAQMLRDEARKAENRADQFLFELNYRKHIKTLTPLQERNTELRTIINDPTTKKTALTKAQREYDKIDKAFWGLVKYGKHVDTKE